MADIPSLRIGDTLKVPYTIEALIQDQPSNRPVRVDEGLWLRRELVEAAEHIPAPRVFKRGDWVRWNDGEDDFRHCIVLGQSETGHSELLRVDVPGEGVYELYPRFLEPDEAPE